MRDEAFVEVRRKRPIGEHPLVRHREIRLRLGVRNVNVLAEEGRPSTRLLVEAVHPALRARKLSCSVAVLEHRIRRMVDLVLRQGAVAPGGRGRRRCRERLTRCARALTQAQSLCDGAIEMGMAEPARSRSEQLTRRAAWNLGS